MLTDGADIESLADLDLDSWVADRSDQWVMITTDLVSGRRTRGRPGDPDAARRAAVSAGAR